MGTKITQINKKNSYFEEQLNIFTISSFSNYIYNVIVSYY